MKKKLLCLILSAAMLIGSTVTVYADEKSDLKATQEAAKNALGQTNEVLSALAVEQMAIQAQISDINKDIVDMMVRIDEAKHDIDSTNVRIDETNQKIGKTEKKLRKAEKRRDRQYSDMKKRIQFIYEKGGDIGWAAMLFSSTDITSFINKAEYTERLHAYDREQLTQYIKSVEKIDTLKTKLEKQEKKLQEQKSNLEAQKVGLEENEANLESMLADAKKKNANYDEQIAEAKAQAEAIEAIIAKAQAEINRIEEAEREAARQAAAEEAARRAAEEERAAQQNEAAIRAQAAIASVTQDAEEDGDDAYYDDYAEEDYDDTSEETYHETASYDDDEEAGYDYDYEPVYDDDDDDYDYDSDDDYDYDDDDDDYSYDDDDDDYEYVSSGTSGSSIVDYAEQYVGGTYVYGGNSLTDGIDCSHFVYQVLSDTGAYSGGYATSGEWASLGESVSSLSEAQAGDVIVYSGHVAIYDGDGGIIEAQNPENGITDDRSASSSTIVAIRRFT